MIETEINKKYYVKFCAVMVIAVLLLLLTVFSFGFNHSHTYAAVAAQTETNQYGFAAGDGSEQNPFLIMTPAQLDNIRFYLHKENPDYVPSNGGLLGGNAENSEFLPYYFALGADIDLRTALGSGGELCGDGNGWQPIGTGELWENYFYGILDGRGFSIRNLWINRHDIEYVGFFGFACDTAIKNLNIMIDEKGITGKLSAGAFAGIFENNSETSTIKYCSVKGNIKTASTGSSLQGLGGFAGAAVYLEIENSFFEGILEGGHYTGGLIGYANKVSVENSYAKVIMNATEESVAGGIFGYAINFGLYNNINNRINRCFVDLVSDTETDALIGQIIQKVEVFSSYYAERENISINSDKYSEMKVAALNEVQQKTKTSYDGFDFDNVWGFDKNGRLVLRAFGQAYDPPVPLDLTWLYITASGLAFGSAVIIIALMLYRRKKTEIVMQTETVEVVKEIPVTVEIVKEIPVTVEIVKEVPIYNGQYLPMESFTPKEKRVAELLLLGKSYGQIAADLDVTENTAKKHIASVFDKAEVNSQKAFIVKYLRGDC